MSPNGRLSGHRSVKPLRPALTCAHRFVPTNARLSWLGTYCAQRCAVRSLKCLGPTGTCWITRRKCLFGVGHGAPLIGARVSNPHTAAPVTSATGDWTLRLCHSNSNRSSPLFDVPAERPLAIMISMFPCFDRARTGSFQGGRSFSVERGVVATEARQRPHTLPASRR